MIIRTIGQYHIDPPLTAQNAQGVYYQIRILVVTEVGIVAQRVFCPELGWIGWDVKTPKEGKTK
jgi:hypothetical protein